MIGSGSVIYGTVMEGHVVEKSPNDYSRCRYGERALTCPTQPRQRREHPCTWGCAGGGCPDYDNSTERSGFPSSTHRSEEHTSELQSHVNLVCRLLLEKK